MTIGYVSIDDVIKVDISGNILEWFDWLFRVPVFDCFLRALRTCVLSLSLLLSSSFTARMAVSQSLARSLLRQRALNVSRVQTFRRLLSTPPTTPVSISRSHIQ
jgi:hypothetical protein